MLSEKCLRVRTIQQVHESKHSDLFFADLADWSNLSVWALNFLEIQDRFEIVLPKPVIQCVAVGIV